MGVGVVRIEIIFYTCERATCIDASESFYLRTHFCLSFVYIGYKWCYAVLLIMSCACLCQHLCTWDALDGVMTD